MQKGTKKKVFVAISMMTLVAGLYGYMEYTRGSKDLLYTKADYITIAKDLTKEFEENEKAANEKFINKIIAVNGSVKDVIKDGDKFYTVMLGDDAAGTTSVRCSMDANHQTDAALLQLRGDVTIKGICTGFNADDLLGSDVILNRCIIEKKGSE
jgi:tRNA_anti-like